MLSYVDDESGDKKLIELEKNAAFCKDSLENVLKRAKVKISNKILNVMVEFIVKNEIKKPEKTNQI